jgi:hypothetical protein
MSRARESGLGRRLAAGVLSGAVGTAAMDLLLYRRYRRAGGDDSAWRWESAEGVTNWDAASAPGQLGRKVVQLVTRLPPPDRWARPTTNTVHWMTGVAWGLQYAVLTALPSRHPLLRAAVLGPAAWLSGYVVLPLAGVYRPIWKYDGATLVQDLSAHLVYGATTTAAFAALTHRATTCHSTGGTTATRP